MHKRLPCIILEGCDCSGKSTLAKNIASKYGMDIMHCTSCDPKDYQFYSQLMRKKCVVYDRHYVGEMIYPYIYNRKAQLSKRKCKKLTKELEKNNAILFVIVPPDDIIKQRLDNERPNEETEVKEKYSEINAQFKEIGDELCNISNNVHMFLTNGPDIDIDNVYNIINKTFKLNL